LQSLCCWLRLMSEIIDRFGPDHVGQQPATETTPAI